MKIQPSIIQVNSGQDPQTAVNTRGQANAGGQSAPASSSDTISLSALSTQMHALESHLASGGEFDAQKVDAIKQAISDGKLTVNAGAVADKLISATQELLGKSGS